MTSESFDQLGRRLAQLSLGALATVVAGCSGGGGATEPGAVDVTSTIDRSSVTVEPSQPSTSSSVPVATTSVPSAVDAIASDLGGVVGIALGSGNLTSADAACLGPRLDELGSSGSAAIEGLRADPVNRVGVDPDAAEQVFLAYLDCVERPALTTWLALGVLRAPPAALPCMTQQWAGLVDTEAIAASVAHGHGLDDLEPGLADRMAEAAESCLSDPEWWVDEVSLRLGAELDPGQAECVAARYVEVLGVRALIRQRILTLALTGVTADDAARLDLSAQCGAPPPAAPLALGATPGECLTGFGQGTAVTAIAPCDGAHNAEVIEVRDLGDDYPSWPGAQELLRAAQRHCVAAARAIAGDTTGWAAGWDVPGRSSWERDLRALTCVVVKQGYESWEGPSGLAPADADASTSPPTSAPTETTLPPSAREMFSLDEVDRVGMCIYRAPATPGQDDLLRRFFEVGCDEPHQVELVERFDVDQPPTASYPGEKQVIAEADLRCAQAFASYVGTPSEESRLRYTYFYPLAASWAAGDRAVTCLLVGEQRDELFGRSMAGSAE